MDPLTNQKTAALLYKKTSAFTNKTLAATEVRIGAIALWQKNNDAPSGRRKKPAL